MPDRPPLECTEEDIFGFSEAENRELDRQNEEVGRYEATLPDSVRSFWMYGVRWVRPERRGAAARGD